MLLVLKLSCVQLWPPFQCLFLRGASDTDGQISTTSLPGENPPVEGHDLPVEGHDVLRAAAEEVLVVILGRFKGYIWLAFHKWRKVGDDE